MYCIKRGNRGERESFLGDQTTAELIKEETIQQAGKRGFIHKHTIRYQTQKPQHSHTGKSSRDIFTSSFLHIKTNFRKERTSTIQHNTTQPSTKPTPNQERNETKRIDKEDL